MEILTQTLDSRVTTIIQMNILKVAVEAGHYEKESRVHLTLIMNIPNLGDLLMADRVDSPRVAGGVQADEEEPRDKTQETEETNMKTKTIVI